MSKRWLRQLGSIMVATMLALSAIMGDIMPVYADLLIDDSEEDQILSVNNNNEELLEEDILVEDIQEDTISYSYSTSELLDDNEKTIIEEEVVEEPIETFSGSNAVSENSMENASDTKFEIAPEGAASDFTADQALQWIKDREHQQLNWDAQWPGECVDLIACWQRDCLGVPVTMCPYTNYAIDYSDGRVSIPYGWQRLQGVHPIKGDVLIYTGPLNGGHTGVYESDYSTWAQNGDKGKKVEHYTNYYNNGYYWGVLRPNFKSSGNPIGHIDSASVENGKLYVGGWAYDPDKVSTSIQVNVYVDGYNGLVASFKTHIYRQIAGGTYSGFAETIDISKYNFTGKKIIHLWGIDITGNENAEIGNAEISFGESPVGHIDSAKGGVGTINVGGWAYDPDKVSTSIQVNVYVDGYNGPVASFKTHIYRQIAGGTYCGFDETIDVSKYSFTGKKKIHLWGIDITGNENAEIGNVEVNIAKKIPVTGVSINKKTTTLTVGKSETLAATVSPSNASDKSVKWSTSNANIATVGTGGVVTAKSIGKTTIMVQTADGNRTASCTVTVIPETVSVTGVSLNKSSTSIIAGKTETLTATVAPSNATNKSVTWTSSNTNVATVSNTGVVTARAQGTATITVKTVDGNKTATCKVTVNPAIISVTGVSLNKSSTKIIAGNTESLTATISPSNATNKNVTWTSSNSNVATVTSSGVVTARTEGTADITVKTADGGKSAVCRVSVVTPPQHVVEHYSPDGRVGVPYSFTFESDGTKPLTWEVLDLGSSSYEIPKGLTLSSSGVLSGIPEKAGAYQFYITVSNAYGKYGFYCKTAIIGEKLSFSLDSLPKGKVGEYYDITIQPISDTPYSAYINIEGEDESSIGLRAVNGNGLRICGTPTKAGVFTVVCEGTNYDGHSEKRYDLVIEGNKAVTGVELNKSSTTIVAGNTEALRATVTPYDAADKTVTWTSSNTNVATVTADGLVTAKAEGTADIKVKTNDGGKTATCKVRVVTIPGITTSSLPNGRVGESYTISMTASGTTPITWSIISGSLPSGLILDPDGTIYGAPTAAGIYTFSVQAKNFYGSSPAKQLSININPSKPVPGPGGDETNGTDTIIVAGQRIDLKEVCFKNVHGSIDRYVVDDRRFASISKTVLSGTKEGKVTVTAQSKIGSNIYEDVAKCQVTILNRPNLKFSKQLTYVGQAINASDYFTTSDTNVLGATYWESTNPSVVEVTDPIFGKLVAHKNGTANISAYFGDKGKNGTFKVSATISVKIPSFQKNEYSVQTGADLILAMKNVTKAQNPTWATENGSVATATAHLDSKGNPTGKVLIKGINYGDTTLIATIDGQKYRCVIHVTAPKISRTALSIKTGRTANLSLQKTKLKKNQIIWKSSNESVAKVDANGKVTGVASGKAIIYTTAGGIKNECVVTVQ